MTNELVLAAAYRGLFGREPDEQGFRHWIGKLQAGMRLDQLLRELVRCEEFRAGFFSQHNAFGEKLAIFDLMDFKVALPPDDWMLQSIVHAGEYEPYVMRSFLEVIEDADTVLDVGANIGVFTIAAAKHAHHVIAVEASTYNAKIIAVNLFLNKISNATVYPVAISSEFKMATFSRGPTTNKTIRHHHLSIEHCSQIDVAMAVPIDILLENEHVDVVKIDIEGHEYAALCGARKLFGMLPIFFTEYSDDFIHNDCGLSGKDYLNLFFERGYIATILHRDLTREDVSRNCDLIHQRWTEYVSREITHLDLLMRPTS